LKAGISTYTNFSLLLRLKPHERRIVEQTARILQYRRKLSRIAKEVGRLSKAGTRRLLSDLRALRDEVAEELARVPPERWKA